jgi:hypothetical protein
MYIVSCCKCRHTSDESLEKIRRLDEINVLILVKTEINLMDFV